MKEYESDGRVMPFILDDKATTLENKVFVSHKEDTVTYGQLSEGSDRVANTFIHELGVQKGDNIAVMFPNCVDYFYTQFGISKAAAVMVLINVQAKLDLLTHFLNQSDSEIVVVDEQFVPSLQAIESNLPNVRILVIRAQEFSRDKFSFRRGFEIIPYEELFNGSATSPEPDIHWYDPVDIFYTSGTTGVSKGVVLPYNHHYTFGFQIAEFARLGPEDVMYICLPLYHGMGSYMCIMPMLLCEGSIYLADRFSATRWLSEIRHGGATATWAVYSMAPILMKQPEREDDADNPLRVYLYSGIPPDLVEPFERRFGLKAIESYGSTEQENIAYTPWDRRKYAAVGPVNSAMYDVRILNEYDEEVPVGEVGEIVSRGKYPYTRMIEYYKMPEETVKAFRNCWLHSGDMGRVDEDGWLYFVGRGKDTIRRRGENISCYELESILSSHEAILETAAIPVLSELGEDDVKVVIVPRAKETLDFRQLIDFCDENMPKYMVPRYIEIMKELPKLPNEKVDKEKLKKDAFTPKTWDVEIGEFVKLEKSN